MLIYISLLRISAVVMCCEDGSETAFNKSNKYVKATERLPTS
jgi:hypothetical protein